MKKSFFRLPEDISPRARNAFRAVLTFVPATVIILGFLLYQAFQTPSLQLWSAAGSVGVLLIFVLLGLSLTLRNQPERGVWLTFVPWLLILLFNSALVSGLGLLILVSAVTIVILIAGSTLPDKQKPTFIATGVVFGLLSLLVDLFIPTERIVVQGFQTVVYVVLGLCLLLLGSVILRQFRNYSLRTKMVTVFVVTVVVSVSVVAFLTGRSLSTSLTEQIGASLAELANAKAVELGQAVDRESDVLKTLAFNKAVQDAAQRANWSNALSQVDIEQLDQQWRAADEAGNDADPLVASVLRNSLASDLRRFQEDFPQHVEVFLTDQQGVSIATTNRTSDYYQADEEWWQTAYQEGLFIGQPEYDESSKTIAINMATAVRADGSDKVVGILRTTVNFDTLTDSLVAGLFGQTGHTDIYLPNGQELSLQAVGDGTFELVMKEAEVDINVLTQSGETYLEIPNNEIPTLASQALVYVFGDAADDEMTIANLNWHVVVLQDQADALQPVETQTRNLLFLAIAISIMAGIAAIGLAQIVAGPIVRLTAVAEKVASGDLLAQAQVETGDEIGTLATTFNTMTAKLRESIGTLEQRVAERTQNLELAAEVGRSVSQVRALDVMLQDACELIQKEFALYYVQVYLTDPSQTALQLQAGTGEVGAQLRERGHSLKLNTSSINGRAALEKRTMVISDTAESATFRPNELLPDTRGEMAVPLIVGEKVVGVLDMQSGQPGVLNEEVLPAFEALAGQLAVAIQNATLVAEAQEARAEVEAQARRLVRTGWSEHLDAIHKPEHLGFVFDRNEVTPLDEADELPDENRAVSAPISLTGEMLGSLVVELDDENKNEQTSELVNIVAHQVAQQIENLRLLENAERFRYEAEQAARRQTREGWQEYVKTKTDASLGYLYDLNEVRPYNNGKDNASALTLPLKVRNETIGKLSVDGLMPDDKDSFEFANAVAQRLGAHIESLRQHDQTQSALAQSEKLFDASRSLTQATDLQELVAAAVTTLGVSEVNRAILATFDYDETGEVEQLTVVGNWWNGNGQETTPVGTRYPLEVIQVMPMFISPTPVFFNDTFNDERVDATTMDLVKKLNLRAVAALPLHIGSHQIGSLILEAEEPHSFTQDETRLFAALAPQVSTVLENRQQYERAQNQAEREAMLNAISQKIQSATSVEAVLQIAARELGHALGAPMTIAQLGMKDQN
jgi:GAF domain-containing protein/HAMP domain-containing protein